MPKSKTEVYKIEITTNTDPALHPYTVSCAGLEFSGKNLRALLRKLVDAMSEGHQL